MYLHERVNWSVLQNGSIEQLVKYPVSSTSDLTEFLNMCQSVFLSILFRKEAYINTPTGITKVIVSPNNTTGDIVLKSKAREWDDSDRYRTKTKSAPAVFNFYIPVVPITGTNTKAKKLEAEGLFTGNLLEVVKEDGTPDTETFEELKQIRDLCFLAIKDPDNYNANATADFTKKSDIAAKVKAKAHVDDLTNRLSDAQARNDEAEIAAINRELDDLHVLRLQKSAATSKAKRAERAKAARDRAMSSIKQQETSTGVLETEADIESFIYGWMARNVKFICAYVPYVSSVKYGKVPTAPLRAFQNSYPESKFLGTITLDDVEAGNTIIHPKEAPGYYYVPKYNAGGALTHKNLLFVVVFDPEALKARPAAVDTYLSNQWSNETKANVKVDTKMLSISLATDLYRMGFPIDAVTSNVVSEVRGNVTNPEAFDLGYNYPETATKVTEPDPYDDEYDFYDHTTKEFPDPVDYDED